MGSSSLQKKPSKIINIRPINFAGKKIENSDIQCSVVGIFFYLSHVLK